MKLLFSVPLLTLKFIRNTLLWLFSNLKSILHQPVPLGLLQPLRRYFQCLKIGNDHLKRFMWMLDNFTLVLMSLFNDPGTTVKIL